MHDRLIDYCMVTICDIVAGSLGRRVDLLEPAVLKLVREWWTVSPAVAATVLLRHEESNRQIIEEHRQLVKGSGRPLRTAGPKGTRKARTKRRQRRR